MIKIALFSKVDFMSFDVPLKELVNTRFYLKQLLQFYSTNQMAEYFNRIRVLDFLCPRPSTFGPYMFMLW